uniref:IRG-type G domain-containing protein n=1 Tax=Chelydra serpentina TaxID=8475 RepID=A0A8C3S7I8_CHESE
MGNFQICTFCSDLGQIEILKCQNFLPNGNLDPEVAALEAQEALESFENMVLNIAVTGETGAGKSSFINAIRGLVTEDKGAAPTSVTEMTTEPTAYPHPTYPIVTLWDLPGIGAIDFRPERYLQQVNFSRYDFFIIVASERFRSSHADLAQEIQRMEKKFYFVRCKADEDLANERRAHPKIYSPDSVLQRIRENSQNHLRHQGVSNPQVFLLSNWEFDHYDFHLLEDALERDLPRLQRLVFLLSLPNLSPEIIEKKKAALKKHLWKISLVSACINAVPLERVSLACDVGILLVSMIAFYKRFGLDDDSLAKLAKQAAKPVTELKAVILLPQAEELTRDILMKKSGLSFITTYSILSSFLDKVAEDAKRIRKKTCGEAKFNEDLEELKAAIEGGNLSEMVSKVQESLEQLKNMKLNLAITGESGCGKSSFINAMLGLNDDENEDAAKVDVTETTMEPTPYPHPEHPNVTMWDLPGIGTPSFQPDSYLQQVNFACYDFFIIIASERFKSTHADLAQEIQRMGKKFYFVRSKVDADLQNEKRKKSFSEGRTLQKIRDDCVVRLQGAGVSSPQVFLVSRWDFDKYDSPRLQETLVDELDSLKRHIFLLSLPSISGPILIRKKKALQDQVWKHALLSCLISPLPIPGLSFVCDVSLLMGCMACYRKSFGLDNDSLVNLSQMAGKPIADLKAVIKSRQEEEISKMFTVHLLGEAEYHYRRLTECFRYIPFLFGTHETTTVSFSITYATLQRFLNDVAEDAQRVLTKALEAPIHWREGSISNLIPQWKRYWIRGTCN